MIKRPDLITVLEGFVTKKRFTQKILGVENFYYLSYISLSLER